jgi:hypothetical protein
MLKGKDGVAVDWLHWHSDRKILVVVFLKYIYIECLVFDMRYLRLT